MKNMQKAPADKASKPAKFNAHEKTKKAFHNAKQRCQNTKNPDYPNYGGVGILFLYSSPADLIDDIGLPKPDESLDRIDPKGNYEPGNTRWTNKAVQAANKKLSSGGATPSLGQLIHKAKLKQEQMPLRGVVAENWTRSIRMLTWGQMSASSAQWFDEHAEAVGQFDWSFDISDHPEIGQAPGLFRLPSLTMPGRAVSVCGGPVLPCPNYEPGSIEASARERLIKLGLIPWFHRVDVHRNVPQTIIDWMNADLKDPEHLGAFWYGQPPAGAERSGWVEIPMLALASYLGQKTSAVLIPLSVVLDVLKGVAGKWALDACQHPCVTAKHLFLPDFQVNHSLGWNPSPAQWAWLFNLLEHRAEHGLRTFVGVQNHQKLPTRVQEFVFTKLRHRTMPSTGLIIHPLPQDVPNPAALRHYLGDGWDLTRLRQEHMASTAFIQTE